MGIDFIYPLYGKIVKRYINIKPKFAYKLIKIGVSAEKVRCKILPDLKAPKGLRMINYYDMNSITDAWRNKEKRCGQMFLRHLRLCKHLICHVYQWKSIALHVL